MIKEAENIGPTLNASKCEIITRDHTTLDTILTSLPRAHKVDPAYPTLLGSSLGDGKCISNASGEKTAVLKRVGERFVALSTHDAFNLFQHSFAIPKLLYLLRIALCYQSEALVKYDNTPLSIMGEVTNMEVVSKDRARKQASFSVKVSGLGVRSVVEVAPSAYLASLHVASAQVEAILSVTFTSSKPTQVEKSCKMHQDHATNLAASLPCNLASLATSFLQDSFIYLALKLLKNS